MKNKIKQEIHWSKFIQINILRFIKKNMRDPEDKDQETLKEDYLKLKEDYDSLKRKFEDLKKEVILLFLLLA